MKFQRIFLLLLLLAFCNNVDAQNVRPGKVRKLLKNSEVLKGHFTGFALFDLGKRKMVAEQSSHRYFTPASNTKLFTFYAGLKVLRDSVPGLQYIIKGDSLIFWATGDPVFLHPDFSEQRVLSFLRTSGKNLYWAKGRYKGEFYGVGWSYDDYNEYYQPEISELPVYANVIRLQAKDGRLISIPPLPSEGIFERVTDSAVAISRLNPSMLPGVERYKIRREFSSNTFHQPQIQFNSNYSQEVPFKTQGSVVDTLLKRVLPNYKGVVSMDKPSGTNKIYSAPADSVYKRMLLPSDNFIAEQLLLTYSAETDQAMSTSVIIDYITKVHLAALPDKPQWVDGSGLSRQNLFTPATMVKLCEMIYDEVNNESRLFALLPQGGKTGTLKNYFKSDTPFLFAKTGSLSNNHSLTGFLKTRRGKTLIFSFMNNNYIKPTAEIRKEMERVLSLIHEKY